MNRAQFSSQLRDRVRDRVEVVGATPIVAEIVPTRRPMISSTIYLTVSGATAWGTVTVAGIDSTGMPATEDVVFANNEMKPTSKTYKSVSKITTADFTGGLIEAKTTYKDFDDTELDNILSEALQEFSRHRPQIVVEEIATTLANEYLLPQRQLWIQNITDLVGNDLLWQERNGKYVLLGYDGNSWDGYIVNELSSSVENAIGNLANFRIYYAAITPIADVRDDMIGLLLLCCEALCDKMKSEEPDRWCGYSVNVPGVEKLDISTEFRKAYENKMREFTRRVGVPYGCRS
ncbi:MAG: hypothetical protein QME49_05750 [bacterium]|nr:hypothetical protein [bacterium]